MTEQTTIAWLIDDDTALTSLLQEFLESNQLRVKTFEHGQLVLTELKDQQPPDIMILDIMMPGLTGLQLLPAIRAQTDVPIIMLTGRGDEIDRIIGLEMGADDYIPKPCNPRELLARINAVTRRHQYTPKIETTQTKLSLHGLEIDLGMLTCHYNQQELELTGIEFSVLVELLQQSGRLVSKEHLTEKILQRKLTAYDRSIDVHVSRVRQKLKQAGLDKEIIKTVRGQGYQCIMS
ncbi:response regulator transcription factor [Algibacillus agarilyticus]|uniref:response regulator transcription factor n=1 Tax=Algibacillus agarilyticus TaxID=2234133 RepID=UPI000DCF7F44|nr:response regulator transcription factor [Algibacillus agarilyticus]